MYYITFFIYFKLDFSSKIIFNIINIKGVDVIVETETKEIPFYGGVLLGVRDVNRNVIYLAIRTTAIDIGLSEKQAENEVRKVKKSLLFQNYWKELSLNFKGQVRKITVLHEKFVPMWLAQINITPSMRNKNPEAANKLLTYQLEAADALHKAFYETSEQKEKLHTDLNIKGDISDLKFRFKNYITLWLNFINYIIKNNSINIYC